MRPLISKIVLVGLIALGLVPLLSGCASKQSQLGVKNLWRNNPATAFEKGRTTQSEVMHVLGPPSQVIGLHDQTIFYYLREQLKAKAFYLVVYNQTREQITYDRAIFFFDPQGILKDFAFSDESVPTN
jgi:outer membrane protein assembly factor BamE (lipoprotein component of BamABCDE complex)